ncbi:MAG TPA: HNH endonuclease, partial [Sporichthya sp.]|nr:HNH endonuclease [Sporichthya sp.]
WWENGGQTNVDEMALVCKHEHWLIHHGGWQIRMAQDGHPEMIPPDWVDPDQRPRRNAHWKLIRDGLKQDPDRGP